MYLLLQASSLYHRMLILEYIKLFEILFQVNMNQELIIEGIFPQTHQEIILSVTVC